MEVLCNTGILGLIIYNPFTICKWVMNCKWVMESDIQNISIVENL